MSHKRVEIHSKQREEHKIAASLLRRIEQVAGDSYQAQFWSALRQIGIDEANIESTELLQQSHLDSVIRSLRKQIPDIYMKLDNQIELSDYGLLGYAMTNSETVGNALRMLLNHHEITGDRYQLELEKKGDLALIRPIPYTAFIKEYESIAEDALCGSWGLLGKLLGDTRDVSKASVNFIYHAPNHAKSYYEFFSCPCNFEERVTELRFPASWLQAPVVFADETLADVFSLMCERLLPSTEARGTITQSVRRLLLSRPGRKMLNLNQAAEALCMSSPGLRKRLVRDGTTYKEQVLSIRMEQARNYLELTSLSVQEIAFLLDYSQPAPFSRAFKRYHGKSPHQYRLDSQD